MYNWNQVMRKLKVHLFMFKNRKARFLDNANGGQVGLFRLYKTQYVLNHTAGSPVKEMSLSQFTQP